MREPASQWANCLALVLSGIAILAPQIHSIFGFVFINFLIAGAILGFLWPERKLALGILDRDSCCDTGVINIANSFSAAAVADTLINGAQAFVAGALMGWLGARFSPRRLHHGGSH